MNRRYITIAVLLVLTVGSWWILRSGTNVDDTVNTEKLTSGYYLLDADISDTDDNGHTIYSLHAEHIQHNPGDDSIKLQQLHMTYGSADNRAWTIAATEGWMAAHREKLVLSGEVTVNGDFESHNRETKITTTRLILNIKENVVHTDAAVDIDITGAHLQAVGLHADLNSENIRLLSEVRGSFLPDNN